MVLSAVYLYNGAIYCENYWLTGAFAPTGEIITAPRTMQVTKDPASNTYDQTLTVGEDGLSLKDGTAGGILFAAVLHKNSNDTSGNTWNAVYGTREEGDWRVTDEDASTYDAVCDAITKAKEQNERATWVFSKGSTNDYQAEFKELPGDVSKYMSLDPDHGTFMVQMYYTTASSIDDVTPDNLYKVKSLQEDENNKFTRQFAATFKVPNVANRLVVQKVDDDGDPISATDEKGPLSATFSFYNASDVDVNDDGTFEVHEKATPLKEVHTMDQKRP